MRYAEYEVLFFELVRKNKKMKLFLLLLASLANLASSWSPWGRAWGGQRRSNVSPRAYPMWGGSTYYRYDPYDRYGYNSRYPSYPYYYDRRYGSYDRYRRDHLPYRNDRYYDNDDRMTTRLGLLDPEWRYRAQDAYYTDEGW